MAPKKPTVTSSSTRSARVKGGSNPVVTKGEARTRAARTTLGPAPKQRPMATGGTKGPLQGGTRSPGLKMNASKMEAGPAKVGSSMGQQSTSSSAGPRSVRPPAESRIRSMEAGPGKVRAGMGGGTTLSSKPGANAAGAQAAKDAARMANRIAKGYGMSGKVGAGMISNLKTGVAGVALGAASDKYLAPLARKAGTALGKKVVIPAARALDNALPGINSRDERLRSNSKAAKTGNKSRFAGKRAEAMAKAKGIKGSPVLGSKKVGTVSQSFDKSFAAARKAGKSGFTFKGKKYNTKMK